MTKSPLIKHQTMFRARFQPKSINLWWWSLLLFFRSSLQANEARIFCLFHTNKYLPDLHPNAVRRKMRISNKNSSCLPSARIYCDLQDSILAGESRATSTQSSFYYRIVFHQQHNKHRKKCILKRSLWRRRARTKSTAKRIFFFPITAERHKLYDFLLPASVWRNGTKKNNKK